MERPLPICGQFRALGLMLLHMLLSPWRLNMSQILAITDRDQEPKVLQNALKLLNRFLSSRRLGMIQILAITKMESRSPTEPRSISTLPLACSRTQRAINHRFKIYSRCCRRVPSCWSASSWWLIGKSCHLRPQA